MMQYTDRIETFRGLLGSEYFEGRDFSVMAQFIYEFIFIDAPEEERLGLFSDFILNFWTDVMPRTNLVYHKIFEIIPDELRLELARRMDDILRMRFKEMQENRRMTGAEFATEAFEFVLTLERMDAVFAIFILLTVEKYTPYRHVEVDIVVSPERALEIWLQKPWHQILELIEGFPEGKTISVCRQLMEMIEIEPDSERKVILLYLMFAAIVFMTREFQFTVYVEDESDVIESFREMNKDYISDCVEAIRQIRNGNRKFRHEFDQASYFLENIFRFDLTNRHRALYVALLQFHYQAMIGNLNLPNIVILPFMFD